MYVIISIGYLLGEGKMKRKQLIKFSSIIATSLLIFSCAPQGGTTPTPEVITDENARIYLSHNPSTSHILVGSNRTLSPVLISKKLKKNIKYISSNPGAFTVADNGVVTAVGVGSSLFTIYNDNNNNGQLDENEPTAYASYLASSPDGGAAIVLDKTEITLRVGEETTITPRALGISNPYYSYYVSDSSIATAYNGKVKGLKPGTTNLNIYTGTPAIEANCKITVTDNVDSTGVRADGIEFIEKTKLLKVGESFTPEFSITPSRAVDTVQSLSSNNNVVTVTNNSTVTASKSGTAILTIKTTNNEYDRMKVVVTDDDIDVESYYFNYYGDLTWENGEDLKTKLHDIISHKNSLYYNGSKTNWDSNKAADEYIQDHDYVSAIYSNDPILKSSTNTGWQREHCFAASLMTGITTGDAVKKLGRATDFHNLYAANKSGNTSRGNKNFGYANTESYRYVDTADGAYTYDDKNFEPRDADKGKVARAIFYMGVMYNDKETFTDGGISFDAQPLEIVEDYVSYTTYSYDKFIDTTSSQCGRFLNKYKQIVSDLNPTVTDETELNKLAYQYYKTTNSPCAIGNLSTLLMWNAFDVDEQEMQHNISVCTYDSPAGKGIQGNRNPFADYPELAEYIYGDLQDQPGSLKELDASIKHLNIEDKEAPEIPDDPPQPVEETGIDGCSWNYRPSSGNKNDYSGSGTTYEATFNSMKFDVEFANSVSMTNKNTEPAGVKIGSGSASAGTATITSQQSLNNVDAVYFEACGASTTKYNYKVYVNDVEKLSGEINGAEVIELGGQFEATTGKVKIVISDISAALYLCGFGINYEN